MDAKFDPKTDLPKVSLSEEDLEDARMIATMMNSRGWKVYTKYIQVARESIIDAGKNGIRLTETKNLSALKFAVLKGFDEAMALPDRIVKRAEEFKPEPQGEDNGSDDDI